MVRVNPPCRTAGGVPGGVTKSRFSVDMQSQDPANLADEIFSFEGVAGPSSELPQPLTKDKIPNSEMQYSLFISYFAQPNAGRSLCLWIEKSVYRAHANYREMTLRN